MKYFTQGQAINSSYYASIIDELRTAILEKHHGKISHGVLLLHGKMPVHKTNRMQVAICEMDFAQFKHPAYSPVILPTDYYILSHFKQLLRG